MNKPDFPNWSFDLITKIGGLCAIVTLAGVAVSAGTYVTWLASLPFVDRQRSEEIFQFANKTGSATFPFLGGAIAAACTASFLLDRAWERRKTQDDLIAAERIRQAVEQINAHEIELTQIRPLLNQVSAEQARLSERMAEIRQQLHDYITESDTATDFYSPSLPASSTNGQIDRHDCQFLNPDRSSRFYLRCSQEPCRQNCVGCASFRPLDLRSRRQ